MQGYRRAKETKRGGMDVRKSEPLIVCARQRCVQVGLSPAGALMGSAISESGGNASLASAWWCRGGQGVHCEVESERHEEKLRAVIKGGDPG